jgi:hypothetical protein
VQYQQINLAFPLGGVDVSRAVNEQTASVAPLGAMYDPSFQQQKFETCRAGVNVRGFDALQGRFRGGSRPGLTKYLVSTNASPVQGLGVLATVGLSPPPGYSQQVSQSGRIPFLVVVAGGTVFAVPAGSNQPFAPVGGAVFPASGPLFMAPNAPSGNQIGSSPAVPVTDAGKQVMYFASGGGYFKWVPASGATGTVSAWASTVKNASGVIPPMPSNGTNFARLICTWRGRTVLAGIKTDPQNWFMSAINDPCDWVYSPASTTAMQAVSGNNSPLGLVGDSVMGLVPINDDNLLFLCANSIYIMRGDPTNGGQLQCLEPGIGGQWGQAWCMDTEGVVYFVSSNMGVYSFSQFDYPRRISQHVDPLLQQVQTGVNTFSMVWDDWLQGFHLFVTNTAAPATATTHYFWEKRTGAWWQDTFANLGHNPLCCVRFDGNLPSDRRALIGCADGYVRYPNLSAASDDGTAIASQVVMGPVASGFAALLLRELRGLLGTGSGAVSWSLFAGASAEDALAGSPVASGAWAGGINPNRFVRRAGKALYLQLTSSSQWALEKVVCRAAALGAVRERGVR